MEFFSNLQSYWKGYSSIIIIAKGRSEKVHWERKFF